MPMNEIILAVVYIMPLLVALDKNKLKSSLFVFFFLMGPIFLKIYVGDFMYFVFAQFICWIVSIFVVKLLKSDLKII